MVSGGLVLVKPSFSREKDGFWRSSPGKTIFFSRKRWFFRRMVAQNNLFLEKKMVSNQKTIFFSRKPKKPKKTKKPSFPKLWGWGLQEMVFLVFSRKRWFLEERLLKNHLFLEKKMVSNQKNHLFLEKTKKTIFWRPQPHSFGKDGFFGFFGFFGFLDFFGLLVFVSFLFFCFLP